MMIEWGGSNGVVGVVEVVVVVGGILVSLINVVIIPPILATP